MNPQILIDAIGVLTNSIPELATFLHGSLLGAWVDTAKKTASAIGVPKDLYIPPATLIPADEPLLTEFPTLDRSVRWLQSRNLLTYDEFLEASEATRQSALAIAGDATTQTIDRIRNAFVDNLTEGGTADQFRKQVREYADAIDVSDANLETYYRTYVGQAESAGQRAILEHPLIADEFPYRLWSATRDGRTRATHAAMETHGQNGTAVYRADDPIWQTLYPPCEWNCRCIVIALTIEDAAYHGSQEAREWLRTGEPPANPVYAATPYPIVPPANWVAI